MKKSSLKVIRCWAALMAIMCLLSISIPTAFGDQVISTDKSIYGVGDTVLFSGSGLNPGTEYTLQINHKDLVIYSMEFNATGDGSLPPGLYWDSSSSEPGTYRAKLLNSNNETISESIFGLIEINKLDFQPHEHLLVLGGGAEPYGTVNLTILADSIALLNISVTADENGEFNATIQLPFNITTGTYSVGVYVIRGAVPDIVFHIFVNASVSNMMNVTASELEDLIDLVSGMNLTIKQSLLAKLQNALKKLKQAEDHLLANQTQVAENMLRAAGNILNALLNEIRAQCGKHLDNETAAQMNSSIQEVANKLKVTESRLENLGGGEKDANHATEWKSRGDNHRSNHGDQAGNAKLKAGKADNKRGSSRGKGKG